MRKYIIFILGLGMVVLLIVLNNFDDIKYMFNIDNQYDHIPKELLQEYNATIKKIDDFIERNNLGSITSKSEDFDLDYYSQTIKVGIIPYIAQDDPFKKELEGFINDIDQYITDLEKLEKDNEALYGDEMPASTK